MKLTDYFLPLKKDKPKEAEITSHVLMLRSGMCQQSTSGIYSWLPLGKKVLDKIERITKDGIDFEYGARPIKRTIQNLIENPLSSKIISGAIKSGDLVNISSGEIGEMAFKVN